MPVQSRSPDILRFGVFEVDVRSGELRKQGVRIKLQEQPFQVLAVLLQRPGEVLTREELRNQNWPADTFVDFDNSLNTAINKLREALGDSADNPRFIETLPRRGYRFIAPVTGVDGTARGSASGVSAAARTRSRKIAVTVAVVVLAAGIAGGLVWRARQARHLTEKDTIVLGDFANSTGDAVFDGTLREGLSVQLQQSPFLSLVSGEGIQQTLQMMGQPGNVRLTPQIAREVCQRTNSTAALDGSIALIRSAIQLDPNFAAAYDAMGGENQWIGTALAVENIRKAFELRTRVSEREKLIIEGDYYNVVAGDLMKARQSYTLGEQIYPREVSFRNGLGVLDNALGQYEAGLREYQEAVRLAPSPMSHRFLVYTYLLLNRDEDAAALAREAHGKGLDSGLGAILYSLAFYRNDAPEMSRQVAAWAGKPDQEFLMLALE